MHKLFDRRQFLSSAPLTLLGLTGKRIAWSQQSSAKLEDAIVSTSFGLVRGSRRGDLVTFKGIPYGGPSLGHGPLQSRTPAATLDRCQRRPAPRQYCDSRSQGLSRS